MTPEASLTPRQREVIRAVFRTGSVKEAATALDIGFRTVKNHITEVHHRLGVETTFEVAHLLWLRDLWEEAA